MRLLPVPVTSCMHSVAGTYSIYWLDVSREGGRGTGIMKAHPLQSYCVKMLPLSFVEFFLKSQHRLDES